MKTLVLLSVLLGGAFVAGCSGGSGDPVGPTGKPVWELTLDVDGAPVKLPLKQLAVFLYDDDDVPEDFEFSGDGVVLVGEFPKGVRVGYGEKWDQLFGRSISFKTKGGDPHQPNNSTLTLPGKPPAPVVGGSFTAERVSGKYAGSDGDMTLYGKLTVRVKTAAGEKTYNGAFSVHCVSWG